ncbi:hypothetical protein O0L34_g13835 [Tuta absoluta]|nr:hypothetical protein O0L34_g13835 [Tuta absoluta]
MDESNKNSPCEECKGDEAQLRAEVEHLRQHLAERDGHLVALEAEFHKCSTRVGDLEEQVDTWREKYERLYDSHKRVQKLNQVLEDKLLQMVDKMKGEKSQLTKDIATLSVRLAESKYNYSMLQKENERYKNDMNLAIQLLQCKPDNFVSQKLEHLPVDTQARVSQYVMSKSTSKPNSTTSKNGNENDTSFDASEYEFNISASLMTKILEDSIQDSMTKHCDSCTCTKTQAKPFCYNESYFSVGTQTVLTGEMKNSLCLNCNAEIKSVKSELSAGSRSPHGIKLVNDKNLGLTGPLYIVPQLEPTKEVTQIASTITPDNKTESEKLEEIKPELLRDVAKNEEDIHFTKNNVSMEPAVHHKLCDRTKTYSISSKISSSQSIGHEDVTLKDIVSSAKESLPKHEPKDNISLRKYSQSSMGAVSRTSSIAKSTVSTHKSGTIIGPGPRFCHLRMQAGSKNILLDNAEPDVPPVLYRRQSKCNENPIFKDLNDIDNFIEMEKNQARDDAENDNTVVESTLIDVHVDNNNKNSTAAEKVTAINPVLLNVSSSPLQPLKTHNFSGCSENNNNSQSIESPPNTTEIDNLLTDFTPDVNGIQKNNQATTPNQTDILTPTDNHDVKIFNFDRYEQNKTASQFPKSVRKIDMAQLHSLENTKISKDFAPQIMQNAYKKADIPLKSVLPAIVNVYPNLTQTHLKVNESKKVFTNEQSTSSLSSDDSAAILQKQQLLRVAEWVEQNLEQQNIFNDPLEDEVSFSSMIARKNDKLNRLTATLNELALNMPHPVSKYSKPYTKDDQNNWTHQNSAKAEQSAHNASYSISVHNVAKETAFGIDADQTTVTEISDPANAKFNQQVRDQVRNNLREIQANGDKEISAEDLARMEYNVKKFLLSGPHWVTDSTRSRRTSSKTETDV